MEFKISRVEYFHTTVADQPGEAYRILSALESLGVDLLAFTAVPVGPDTTQLTLFPEDPAKMKSEARKAGMALDGPHRAILVQGDDELGALAVVLLAATDLGLMPRPSARAEEVKSPPTPPAPSTRRSTRGAAELSGPLQPVAPTSAMSATPDRPWST